MNVQQPAALTIADLTNMPVHPMAMRFPMWPEDRLEELAADIAANGLNIPIVVWAKDLMLLDGRNRLAACRIAGILPAVEWYDGDDPRSLIISRNIQTREMSASQKAMLLALEFPEPKRGVHSELTNSTGNLGFDAGLLSRARLINAHAPDMASAVITGATRFADALKVAEMNRNKAKSTESRLERLRADAPDLAQQVVEETLTLDEAEGALHARQKQIADIRAFAADAMREIKAVPAKITTIVKGLECGEPLAISADDLKHIKAAIKQLEERCNDR